MDGIGRRPGWLRLFVREGYRVYVMDRPSYGRGAAPSDTFGTYIPGGGGTALRNIRRSSRLAPGSPRNTGLVGEDVPLQDSAGELGGAGQSGVGVAVEHTEHWLNGMMAFEGHRTIDRVSACLRRLSCFAIADRRSTPVRRRLVTVEGNNNPFEGGGCLRGVTAVPVDRTIPPESDSRK